MNLIKKEIDRNKCNILEFREYQYGLISELIRTCFKYLETHGFTYDKLKYKEEVIDDFAYCSKNHYSTMILNIDVGFWKEGDKGIKEKKFLNLTIPKLIDGQFFRLNGTHYIPQFYIADEPITLKKNSISLYSLFNPMTIYEGDGRVIFLGNNIPIDRFFNLYYDVNIPKDKEILEYFGIDCKSIEPMATSLQNLSNIFNIPPNKEEIKKKVDLLFFDDWTSELYQEYYGIDNDKINMKSILDKSYDRSTNNIDGSFIDIRNKRLVFIEYLLAPLFKSVTAAVNRMVVGSPHDLKYLNIKLGDIVSYFFNELKKANRYDTVNGFSGILNLKGNFRNPKGGDELPPEVSNIHPTFKGKICPITVSNTAPGESITFIPEQNLTNLKFGIFDV